MPFDGARTDEEPRTDLGIGEAVTGEASDLGFLSGEAVAGLDDAFAHSLAGGDQLDARSLGERLHARRVQQLVGRTELGARIDSAVLAAQPFAVEQMRAGELRAKSRTAEAFNRTELARTH